MTQTVQVYEIGIFCPLQDSPVLAPRRQHHTRDIAEVYALIFDPDFGDSMVSSTEDESSSSDSDSDSDLSDPEAGMHAPPVVDAFEDVVGYSTDSDSTGIDSDDQHAGNDGIVADSKNQPPGAHGDVLLDLSLSPVLSSTPVLPKPSKPTRARGQGRRGRGQRRESSTPTGGATATLSRRGCSRGRGRGRGHGQGRGRGRGKRQGKVSAAPTLTAKELGTKDDHAPSPFPFSPRRTPPGMFLPYSTNPESPESLFKLFFDATIVDHICQSSNEYAEAQKEKKPVMYSYYKGMTSEDLYKLLGIIIHLGYRRIPRYRFAWSPSSLCYDPFVAQVMSRNRFEGFCPSFT